jgi:hypothetical protein
MTKIELNTIKKIIKLNYFNKIYEYQDSIMHFKFNMTNVKYQKQKRSIRGTKYSFEKHRFMISFAINYLVVDGKVLDKITHVLIFKKNLMVTYHDLYYAIGQVLMTEMKMIGIDDISCDWDIDKVDFF